MTRQQGFGSGAAGQPNKGYTILAPYGKRTTPTRTFPDRSSQIVAVNNVRETAGFCVDGAGNNFGIVAHNGVFRSFKDPNTGKGTVNQLLGINASGD